jgi:hypothetical protein
VLEVELFYRSVLLFENFTLCDLNNFDVIIGNAFLDDYEVDIFCNESKLRVCAKSGSKLMNLDADHNFALAKMGMNLVTIANELESLSFLLLMSLKIS